MFPVHHVFSSDNLKHVPWKERDNNTGHNIHTTEPLSNIFASKGKEKQLRGINLIVDHGNTTVKGKTNKTT